MNKRIKIILRFIIYFIIFSFVGAFIEFCSRFIGGKGIYYDQGLNIFFGHKIPFIPVYGIGGAILVLVQDYLLEKKVNHILFGFVNGVVITIIELISGYFSLFVFGKIFWSYSKQLFNFEGIISFPMFILWVLVGYIFSIIYILIIKKFENIPVDKKR